MSLIADIRAEPEYRKFKAIVLKVREQLKVERDRKEALAMHAGRTSRRLHGTKQYSPKSLIDASMNDMACRSRLVEIRVQCSLQNDILSDAIKSVNKFITTEYYTDLAKYKTVGQRNAVIDRVVTGALEVQGESTALINMLDELIKDIDKASYHLTHMLEALKLLDSSKGGKVI